MRELFTLSVDEWIPELFTLSVDEWIPELFPLDIRSSSMNFTRLSA